MFDFAEAEILRIERSEAICAGANGLAIRPAERDLSLAPPLDLRGHFGDRRLDGASVRHPIAAAALGRAGDEA
jgi:hypothetical protein